MDYYVHPTAEVSEKSKIGKNTKIWHYVQIREEVEIGANCILGKGVYIDYGVIIGNNVKIYPTPIPLQSLLAKSDLLIGGGATMCLEATYFGVPTIMCRQITSPITDYLEKTGLAYFAKTTTDIIDLTDKHLGKKKTKLAQKIHGKMENK